MTGSPKSTAAIDGLSQTPPWWAGLRERPNIIRAVSLLIFFIFWEYAAGGADVLFIVTPSAIYEAFANLVQKGLFFKLLGQSFEHYWIGTLISVVAGVALGVITALWWQAEYTLDPFINGFYAVPKPALVPLFILWFGFDTLSKVAIIVSIAIFPVIVNTYAGIRDVRGAMLDVGRAFSASPRQIFFKIIVPGSVPYIMTGIRLSVGLAIVGMVVAEFFTAMVGFGGLVRDSADKFETAEVYVAVILIGIIGIASTEVIGYVERRISRWRILEKERVQG
ncbi:MAG: ABC transporter permease [Alphaproteobacteria bacterium]|nr:ABC transporter permease [Alphaproteobacteria bacterium]